MSSDPRLMALPALRKLAEEEARDIWDRHVRLFRASGWDVTERPTLTPVDGDEPRDVSDAYEITVQAQLERLADLTRPASRWELAALIGARLGWEPVDVLQAIQNGGLGWIDLCKAARVDAAELECVADDEALTLIALAVLGGAS